MGKKVCIFAKYFPLVQGGSECQSYLIANTLRNEKFDVFFLTFGYAADKIITKEGYRIYSIAHSRILAKFGKPYFLYYFKIRKILSKERPDIVYRRMGSAILGILSLLKKKLNFRLIWACAHINDLNRFKVHRFKKFLNTFDDIFRIYGIKRADKIFVQTIEQKKLLLKYYNRGSMLFPNLHPVPTNEIIKSNTQIIVLWIANFKTWKQPELFLKLAERLNDYQNVKFIMVGRAAFGKFIEKLNKKMRKLEKFCYKGELSIEDVNKLLSKAHIFINTSLYEGFPNTFIQSWMRKIPSISLNVDPDNIIKINNIGFHSKTFDQMVEDTKILIENKELREDMGERARRVAVEMFSISKNIERLVEFIRNEV